MRVSLLLFYHVLMHCKPALIFILKLFKVLFNLKMKMNLICLNMMGGI